MKVKLIDVETDSRDVEVGTCELCLGTIWVDEPVYIYEVDGKTYPIDMYHWSWGDYYETGVSNVVDYAAWLKEREFEQVSPENMEDFLFELVDQYNEERQSTLHSED